LILVPAPGAPRPTHAAIGARALRNADLGAATAPAHQRILARATTDLLAGGVTLGAGAAHVWDLPASHGAFAVSGTAALRLIYLGRSGQVLGDVELMPGGAVPAIPPDAEMAVVHNLGGTPAGVRAAGPGFGTVSLAYAPTGSAPVVGWQSSSTLLQIGPSSLAARGATLHLPRPYSTRRNRQTASYGVTRASDAVRGQIAVETRLPISVSVVIIVLDTADPTAAGDLAIAASGATLVTSPQRVATRNRRILLYDVTAPVSGATALTISVGSRSGWSIAGVMGTSGRAVEWAERLRSGLPDYFVPEGPISPDGSLTVSYTSGGLS
jgi:hypothetical protein